MPGSIGGIIGNSSVSSDPIHQSTGYGISVVGGGGGSAVGPNSNNGTVVTNQPQGLPIVKSQKKRKEGPTVTSAFDYESSSSNRDDVQSPAYSDISDDSTPVAEPEMIGKYFFGLK